MEIEKKILFGLSLRKGMEIEKKNFSGKKFNMFTRGIDHIEKN